MRAFVTEHSGEVHGLFVRPVSSQLEEYVIFSANHESGNVEIYLR